MGDNQARASKVFTSHYTRNVNYTSVAETTERGFVNPLCCRDQRNSSDGSRQIGPRKIGPETRYGLALGGQEAVSGDDGFQEEDQGDDLLQRITHDS